MSKRVVPDLSVLDIFETPVNLTPAKPMEWSLEKYEAAHLIGLSSLTVQQVSDELKIPVRVIQYWKSHPDFKSYVDSIVLEAAKSSKAKRIMLLNKILDARLETAERIGDYSTLSNKDTLDIVSELRKETQENDDDNQSNWIKTLDALLEKSKTPKLIGSGETQP